MEPHFAAGETAAEGRRSGNLASSGYADNDDSAKRSSATATGRRRNLEKAVRDLNR